jgi:hypothetical protein
MGSCIALQHAGDQADRCARDTSSPIDPGTSETKVPEQPDEYKHLVCCPKKNPGSDAGRTEFSGGAPAGIAIGAGYYLLVMRKKK